MLASPLHRMRIGCIHRSLSFPYWATFAQGIRTGAAELGAELCLPTTDAEDDWETAIAELAQQRLDVVILPHSLTVAFPQAYQPFLAMGIPIIGAEMDPSPPYTSVVRADEAQGAQTVVGYLFERLGKQGKIANIAGALSTARQREFLALLRQHPHIELVHSSSGDWTRESGVQAMRAALAAHPDIAGVFAHNDHMAMGAANVIAEQGRSGQIVVVGFDADPEGLIGIRDGHLAATVFRGLYGIGRTAAQMAARAVEGEQLPAELRVPTRLITAENLVDATLDTVELLPALLHDLTASNQAQRRLQQETIDVQRSIIRELSTPIIPISEAVLIMPLIGSIDSMRAQQVTEAMLQAISRYHAQYLIIDITGIAVVDTAVAQHLIQAAQAVQLLGAQVVLVGISPEIAQTLIGLGIDFRVITTRATLQDGFAYAQSQRKLRGDVLRLSR